MSRKQSLTQKIEAFTSQLPQDNLLEQYKTTHDLVTEHLYLRGQAILLGLCWKARFGGNGGNPAKRALRHGLIDAYEYQLIWELVNVYQSIFNLIQVSWEEIQEYCSLIEDPCLNSEADIFLEILREHYDGRFKQAARGYKLTTKNVLNQAKAIRATISHRVVETNSPITNLSEQERLECGLPQRVKGFCWLPIVLEICERSAKADIVISGQYKQVWERLNSFISFQEQAILRSKTETDPNKRVYSRKFEDGVHYRGVKGGYKLEEIKERDFTLLYKLFPALLKSLLKEV